MKKNWLLIVALTILIGCSHSQSASDSASVPAPIAQAGAGPENLSDVFDDAGDAVAEVPFSGGVLVPGSLEEGEPLPQVIIDNYSAMNVPAMDAFRLLLDHSQLAFTLDEEAARKKVTIMNVTGVLPDVMDRLSEATGLLYTFKNGVLNIKSKDDFVVPIPPAEDLYSQIPDMLLALGGEDVQLDRSSRLITFKASRTALGRIQHYLAQIRKNKVLVVYDTYLWDVSLDERHPNGINWKEWPYLRSGTITNTSPVDSLQAPDPSAFYHLTRLDVSALQNFLRSQGSVKPIAKPVLTHLSGTQSTFHVGQSDQFVSKVGSITAGGAVQTTVETDQVISGLDMTLGSDYQEGTVYMSLDLTLRDLVNFRDFQAIGTNLSLPKTTNRIVQTNLRMRPGDYLLMGGIQRMNEKSGDGDDKAHSVTSELVIVLRPRIIRFVDLNKTGGN